MTLAAWIRPSESQSGWRTILHRQNYAYFLMAGGGDERGNGAGALEDARVALLILVALWLSVTLASGRARWVRGRRRLWWPPVALFTAGSVVDAGLAPSDALIGPILVAMWFALTTSHRGEAASMYLIAAVFTGMTVVSVAGLSDLELVHDDGGIARSAALGLLLITVGLLGTRRGLSRPEGSSAALPGW